MWRKALKRFIAGPTAHLALIAAVGILVYSNTFHVPFHFDDKKNIIENPAIKEFQYFLEPSRAQELGIGSYAYMFKTRYIGYLTLALNYKFGGLDVRGYHAVNLAVHVANALLLYWLVRLTLRTPFFMRTGGFGADGAATALIAALLFVSHPLQTQAVTYIVQRLASLAVLFYLLSMVLYTKARLASVPFSQTGIFNPKSSALLALSVLSAALAMKTKENAFTLPFMVAVYEFMFFEDSMRKRALYLAPMALTLLIIPFAFMDIASWTGSVGSALGGISSGEAGGMSGAKYLFTEIRVVVTYIRLLFLPINQNVDYAYPVYSSLLIPTVLLSFVFLLSVICQAFYLLIRSKHEAHMLRLVSFGVFWFFIALSVESGIVPIADVIFEHRVYLPSAGAFMALAALSMAIKRSASARKSIVAATMVVVLFFSLAAYARNGAWGSEISLWEGATRKSPSWARTHANLGISYADQGRYREAERELLAAIALRPDLIDPHINLGAIYAMTGRLAKAVRAFEEAVKRNPGHAYARNNLGAAYEEQGRHEEAERELKAAIAINADYAAARNNLGVVYEATGRLAEALREYEEAVRLSPGDPDFRSDLEHLKTTEER